MPSQPSSPVTPSRRRRSLHLSNLETSQGSVSPSPYASHTTNGTAFSRRSSRTSQTSYQQHSPVTPRPMSSRSSNAPFFHRRKSSRGSVTSNLSIGEVDANGLGSLADELGEAWDEEAVEGQGSSFLEDLREGNVEPQSTSQMPGNPNMLNDMHDFGFAMDVQSPPSARSATLQPLLSPGSQPVNSKDSKGVRHQRSESQYDGSDYGPESSDEDLSDLPPGLAKRIREVEKVTRMSINTEDTLSEEGGVVKRTTAALKDLGAQSSIENGTTRLITACTSMATHRTHKTRELFSQAHSLLYGGVLNLPEEMIDLLLSEIEELSSSTFLAQQQNPLLSLQILSSNTTDLVHSLRTLTDVLQESRIASTAASRKLKSAREMVEDMLIEEELRSTSILLIQAGDWDRRCRERQAAKTCREIVTGFNKTCDLARERWVGYLEYEESLAREQQTVGMEVKVL